MRPFATRDVPTTRRPFASKPNPSAMPPTMARAAQRVATKHGGRPIARPFGSRGQAQPTEQQPAASLVNRSELLSTQNDLLRAQNVLLERIANALEQFTPPGDVDESRVDEEPVVEVPLADPVAAPTEVTEPTPGETMG